MKWQSQWFSTDIHTVVVDKLLPYPNYGDGPNVYLNNEISQHHLYSDPTNVVIFLSNWGKWWQAQVVFSVLRIFLLIWCGKILLGSLSQLQWQGEECGKRWLELTRKKKFKLKMFAFGLCTWIFSMYLVFIKLKYVAWS